MDTAELLEQLNSFDHRLENIEALLMYKPAEAAPAIAREAKQNKTEETSYSGLTGGVHFLIDRGYFSSPRTAAEVIEELSREGYHHQHAAVRKTLGAYFTHSKKLLTRIKDNGVYKYARRK